MPFLALSLAALLALFSPSWGQAVLKTNDTFEMRLSGVPVEHSQEFALQVTVDDNGMVTVPYIGAVRAAGTSASTFARAVEQKLVGAKLFTSPTIIISVQPQSRFVTVGGAVRAPQAVPWSSEMTLTAAINRAGGFSEFADRKRVKVTRGGQILVANTIRFEKFPAENPKMLPGDEVEVRE